MFIRKVKPKFLINIIGHQFSTTPNNNYKVCCVGAAGGIGQPLSLLLKLNPFITQLSLFDVVNTEGIALDLSHIETVATVNGFTDLNCALENCDIVVIPAGIPRKPGMTRDDLFNTNCKIIESTVNAIANTCPKALIAIITNPINSIVPLAAEILTQKGVYDKKRLFGVTTLDLVRTRSFIGQILKVNPCCIRIPVIGGHAGKTILPIISQCTPELKLSDDLIKKLIKDIQDAGTAVVKAKQGTGSATLSMAYSASSFVNTLLHGLNGERNVQTYTYVDCDITEAKFFATLVTFGKNGIEEICGLPKLNDFEKQLVQSAFKQLHSEIQKGIDFAKKDDDKECVKEDKQS